MERHSPAQVPSLHNSALAVLILVLLHDQNNLLKHPPTSISSSEGILSTISALNGRGLGTGDGSPKDNVSDCACNDDDEASGDGSPDDELPASRLNPFWKTSSERRHAANGLEALK